MTTHRLKKLHLSLLKDVLPIGIAIAKRTWSHGVKDVIQIFTKLESPVVQLREEGDEAARLIRQKLDSIQPGLGNPMTEVEIHENREATNPSNLSFKMKELEVILTQIDQDLNLLGEYLENL
uniref:Uncharacterized protein n=1 Tax=Paulinella longichromatophora TaxID=1708747 RepID=A0A2H4ZPG0_9EUKA|nr:hypothetical protein PLO_422 [Paulinella longichromatophora]